MIFSYQWLKELSGTKKTPKELTRLLMMRAFEVESVEKYAHGLADVVVGEISLLSPHPNANRLRVATVRVGRGETHTIVCGAPNVLAGQKVAVALPGTVLPNGVTIQEARLRGVLSEGMICSEKELGLSENHQGILVLPEDAPIGAFFARHYGFDDTTIDIKILPDRGSDALSHEGMAREIAALDGYAPRFEEKLKKFPKIPAYNRSPKVTLADKKGCLRYSGLFFREVSVTASPLWLQAKLLVAGLRPKNNIVDATNYLMLLTGQPVHAFDAEKIQGGIVVRRAHKNEKLTLLNGESIKLSLEDVVIADEKKVLALAGVMGGQSSAVSEKTKDIFIEIAVFDPASVRRTKTFHNLPTDASYRFERGLDPNLPTEVLREAARLFTDLSGGKLSGLRDVISKKTSPWKIRLSQALVKDVLGVEVPLFDIVRLLALLGLKVKKLTAEPVVEVTVPTRRPDLRDEWNLIEEIGRMRGYEQISPVAPSLPLEFPPVNPEKKRERSIKETLVDLGFDEILTYSFYGEKEARAARLPLEYHLVLENPLQPDQNLLRFALAPNALRKAGENLRHFETFSFFEYGRVFRQEGKTPIESSQLIALTAASGKKDKETFLDLKGKIETFLKKLRIESLTFEPLPKESEMCLAYLFHPAQAAVILSKGKVIGLLGNIHPTVAKHFGLGSKRIALACFDIDLLSQAEESVSAFVPLQKFPYARRDISLWFPRTVSVSEAEAVLREGGGALLHKIELFDIYEKDDEKSISFHLSFGSPDRTLSAEESDQAFLRIVRLAEERHHGYIRSE